MGSGGQANRIVVVVCVITKKGGQVMRKDKWTIFPFTVYLVSLASGVLYDISQDPWSTIFAIVCTISFLAAFGKLLQESF